MWPLLNTKVKDMGSRKTQYIIQLSPLYDYLCEFIKFSVLNMCKNRTWSGLFFAESKQCSWAPKINLQLHYLSVRGTLPLYKPHVVVCQEVTATCEADTGTFPVTSQNPVMSVKINRKKTKTNKKPSLKGMLCFLLCVCVHMYVYMCAFVCVYVLIYWIGI